MKEHVELIEEKTRKRNVCKIPKMAADILEDYFSTNGKKGAAAGNK